MAETDFLGRYTTPHADGRPAWNGVAVTAEQGTAVVADDERFPAYWARDLIGQRIAVVKVLAPHGVMYLDDRLGHAWQKVMNGGTSRFGHAEAAIEPGSFAPVPQNGDRYDDHCPTCDAAEPDHTPTCAVVHIGIPEAQNTEEADRG